MTEAERRAALEGIADEVRACTRCRLHEGRTQAVPGEGHPSTEVVLVGEGPGLNEDRQGRPFVGAAGQFLTELLGEVGWRREDVFITNIVKCRPPQNRDPEPDEIAACAPYLRRQLETLDPALVVTLGRHSMGRFLPGARIGQVHGTYRPAPSDIGAGDALVFAMYHPAAALHQASLRQTLLDDMAAVPAALLEARRQRGQAEGQAGVVEAPDRPETGRSTPDLEADAVTAVASPVAGAAGAQTEVEATTRLDPPPGGADGPEATLPGSVPADAPADAIGAVALAGPAAAESPAPEPATGPEPVPVAGLATPSLGAHTAPGIAVAERSPTIQATGPERAPDPDPIAVAAQPHAGVADDGTAQPPPADQMTLF